MAGDVLMVRDVGDFDMRAHPGARLVEAVAETEETPPRLAFVKGPPWAFAEPYMDQLFGAYVDGLSDIPEVTLAGIFDDALDAQATIMNANVWMNLHEYVDNYEDSAHTHDLHATILHQLGIDHEKLTFRHAGRDFRLTDVRGNILHDILS